MTFFANFSNVEIFFFDNVVAIVMKSRWMINIFEFDITDASYFDDQNITNFLNKYENFVFDFKLIEFEKMKRLSRYCEIIIAQSIKIINYWIVKNWTKLRKILLKKYKTNNVIQKMHFRRFLKIYKNKFKKSFDDIRQYCKKFLTISNNLIKFKKINNTTKIIWFIQKLLHIMQK